LIDDRVDRQGAFPQTVVANQELALPFADGN
jgi:hypothetical protein